MWGFDKIVIETSNSIAVSVDQTMPTISLESNLVIINPNEQKLESNIKVNILFWSTKVSISFVDKTE